METLRSATGSRHLFGCSCSLCQCVAETLNTVLRERPDLCGMPVYFDPERDLVLQPSPPTDSGALLLCTTKAASGASCSSRPHETVQSRCGGAAAAALRAWLRQEEQQVRCRESALGGVTLELPHKTGRYCRGAIVRRSDKSNRLFHVIHTISTVVRVEELLPCGDRVFVFQGLARGYDDESSVASVKTLSEKVQVAVTSTCTSREEGDLLWSDSSSGATLREGPGSDGDARLEIKGAPCLELAVPVTPTVFRPFEARWDSEPLSKALRALEAISRMSPLEDWNILYGPPEESGVLWRLAVRRAPQSGSYPGSSAAPSPSPPKEATSSSSEGAGAAA